MLCRSRNVGVSSSRSFNCGILILSALLLIFEPSSSAVFIQPFHSFLTVVSFSLCFVSIRRVSVFLVCSTIPAAPQVLQFCYYMAVTYGYDAAPENDPFVSNATRLMENVVSVVSPERAALHTAFLICEFPVRTSI